MPRSAKHMGRVMTTSAILDVAFFMFLEENVCVDPTFFLEWRKNVTRSEQ